MVHRLLVLDSFHMVCRLFCSLKICIVRRPCYSPRSYSPQTCRSIHSLDSPLSPAVCWLYFFVDGQHPLEFLHRWPPCWPMACVHWTVLSCATQIREGSREAISLCYWLAATPSLHHLSLCTTIEKRIDSTAHIYILRSLTSLTTWYLQTGFESFLQTYISCVWKYRTTSVQATF